MGNQVLASIDQLTWLFSQGRLPHTSPGGAEGTNYAARASLTVQLRSVKLEFFPSLRTTNNVHKYYLNGKRRQPY